jgi:Mg2+ and Co2+ transporter CorA
MDSLMNLRESRINVNIAVQQSRIAEVGRRDSTSMKTLALLGSLFLPGTFLSSVFSMSFFNFQGGESPD